jgi:hypothetical protein
VFLSLTYFNLFGLKGLIVIVVVHGKPMYTIILDVTQMILLFEFYHYGTFFKILVTIYF